MTENEEALVLEIQDWAKTMVPDDLTLNITRFNSTIDYDAVKLALLDRYGVTINLRDNPLIDTEPHEYRPLKWYDRFLPRGRCALCMAPSWTHPVTYWVKARAYGDMRWG